MEIPKRIRAPIVALVMSAAGILGVANFEGFKDTAYIPVPGDVPTIGYGNTTYQDGSKVKMGDKITRQDASALLGNKISSFEKGIKSCVKAPLYQYEYDAYVSLSFNIGVAAFCGSTLTKKLNTYDYYGACQEILKWDKFKGKTLPGLTNRRQAEFKTCTGQPK